MAGVLFLFTAVQSSSAFVHLLPVGVALRLDLPRRLLTPLQLLRQLCTDALVVLLVVLPHDPPITSPSSHNPFITSPSSHNPVLSPHHLTKSSRHLLTEMPYTSHPMTNLASSLLLEGLQLIVVPHLIPFTLLSLQLTRLMGCGRKE